MLHRERERDSMILAKKRVERERGKLGRVENKDRVKDGWITLEAEGGTLAGSVKNTLINRLRTPPPPSKVSS